MKHLIAVLSLLLLLSACASSRRLANEEQALGTDGPITHQFHSALYYPFELTPRFDGYLVGIEKVKRPADHSVRIKKTDNVNIGASALDRKFNDGKVMAITHIIRHSADARINDNCTVFNAYVQPGQPAERQLLSACHPPHVPLHPANAYSNSWEALGALQANLGNRIKDARSSGALHATAEAQKPYSHILVIVMGWNTVQEEAVRNVNSITWNLWRAYRATAVAGTVAGFHPLVITVTWPSQWSSAWIDPAIKIVSFPTKAEDADEVGLSWLGQLLHGTLPAAQNAASPGTSLPVVVVGHSFGAKAASVAACVGPVVVKHDGDQPMALQRIDAVVNLQPAYLSERLLGAFDRSSNMVYRDHCSTVDRFVMTASRGDRAVPLPVWGLYAGDAKSFDSVCGAGTPQQSHVRCAKASAAGEVTLQRAGSTRVTYVDASDLISENAFGTSGGSHSDIYRLEHGIMLRDIIQGNVGFASTPQQ